LPAAAAAAAQVHLEVGEEQLRVSHPVVAVVIVVVAMPSRPLHAAIATAPLYQLGMLLLLPPVVDYY
jgi:hypothetical protein